MFSPESITDRSKIARSFPFIGYLLLWSRYLFIPYIYLKSLQSHSLLRCAFCIIFLFFLSFSMSTKVDLAIILFLLFFPFLERVGKHFNSSFVLFVFIFVQLVSFAVFYLVSPFRLLVSSMVMRSFFIQGIITHNYANFFEQNDLIYLTHINLFNHGYSYHQILPKLLGSTYGGGNLNSSFFAVEGIASFGIFFGPIIGCFMAGMMCCLANTLQGSLQLNLSSLIVLIPIAIPFCDIPLTTSLFSGGILFAFILFSLDKSTFFQSTLNNKSHA